MAVHALPKSTPASGRTRASLPLRLRAVRGHIGLELDSPLALGPFWISELLISLTDLTFPLDLTGGVRRFRHRRGTLEHLTIRCSLSQLTRYITPKLRQVLGSKTAEVAVLPREQGITIGFADELVALAFDVLFVPDGGVAQFVVTNARAWGPQVHPQAAAIAAVSGLVAKLGKQRGSVFVLDKALRHLLGEALLDAGARLPKVSDFCVSSFRETDDGFEISGARLAPPLESCSDSIRGLQLGRISEEADEALVKGSLDRARELYVSALCSAPQHPDLVLRLAALDITQGAPSDAILAMLIEAMPALEGGLLSARLLHSVGDLDGAAAASRRAAEAESFGPLAAMMLVAAANATSSPHDKLAILDEAVARSVTSYHIRWLRAEQRLVLGRVDDAVADFGQLEMATSGSVNKFSACMRAGGLLKAHFAPHQAAHYFQRALRFIPSSPEATVALARSLITVNESGRATSLLARAVALCEHLPEVPSDYLLELAQALADTTHDLPTAIHYVRRIARGTQDYVRARALEARWRTLLGDPVGASEAYAQARDALQALPKSVSGGLADVMVTAAKFELDERHMPSEAKRHAEVGLSLSPSDPTLQYLFRLAAAHQANSHQGSRTEPSLAPEAEPSRSGIVVGSPGVQMPTFELHEGNGSDFGDAGDEELAEELTSRLRSDPTSDATAIQLCECLLRLNRFPDLLALASVRLEESSSSSPREDYRRFHRTALIELIADCERNARTDEAALYRDLLEMTETSDSP